MRNKNIITILFILGIFIVVDLSMLAQTVVIPEAPAVPELELAEIEEIVKEAQHQAREAQHQARDASRAAMAESARSASRSASRASSSFSTGFGDYFIATSSDKTSSLMLSKTYDGETAKKEGSFTVESGSRKVKLQMSGLVESGLIEIEIYKPGGKLHTELNIDDSAEVHWSQSISMDEDEDEDNYYGKWTYIVRSVKAKGSYHLMINTY